MYSFGTDIGTFSYDLQSPDLIGGRVSFFFQDGMNFNIFFVSHL